MALKSIDSGELLEVLLDTKPSAEETLPSYCKKLGYDYEVVEESGYWRFFIKKA
ncbi:SirA-like protein [archaeon]|nr:SirA-like protein [archaeon]